MYVGKHLKETNIPARVKSKEPDIWDDEETDYAMKYSYAMSEAWSDAARLIMDEDEFLALVASIGEKETKEIIKEIEEFIVKLEKGEKEK